MYIRFAYKNRDYRKKQQIKSQIIFLIISKYQLFIYKLKQYKNGKNIGYYYGWIYRLSACYPEFPVGKAIEDILQSDFHLTKGNYLYPLVENYIAKYNAEYGEADRQRRQEETMRNRRKTLELLGVAVRDQQEILQLASVAPMVLDTALKETWGNKRIKSPTRFILSRMRQAVSA